jgi:hypothetical protein
MDSKNGKILFVVYTTQHYRDFLKTGALSEIKDRLIFLVDPGLVKMDFGVSSDRVIYYSFPKNKEINHRRVFNINSFQNRKRIPVFTAHQALAFKSKWKIFKYKLLALPVLNSLLKFIFLILGRDKKLFELVSKINPSLLIIPSHAYEGMTFELIRIARKLKIPSFMIADSWDTLPTKTTFTYKPDYVGVQSRQSVEHAVDIKGMPRERVVVLGFPRFMGYLKSKGKIVPSPYPFPYVVYVGISGPFNELGALRKMDEMIEKYKLNIKVIYRANIVQRPRKCPDVFFEYDFKHVILDTPARTYYKMDMVRDSFNPILTQDIDYYVRLLSNMEFMICPESTMILEGSLMDKRVYVLVYDDGIHAHNPSWDFKNDLHVWDTQRLKNVRMVHKFEDIEKIFTPGDLLKQEIEPIDIDYFVSKEATLNYSQNLNKNIEKILSFWNQNN